MSGSRWTETYLVPKEVSAPRMFKLCTRSLVKPLHPLHPSSVLQKGFNSIHGFGIATASGRHLLSVI